MKLRPFFLLSALLAPAAFAKHPRNLEPVEAGGAYVLQEDVVSQEKAATFTLKAGTYTAELEDAKALYLLGDEHCLEMRVVPPKQPEHAYTMPFNCGIYLPKDPAGKALFFTIRGEIPYNPDAGFLINAIIKYGEGGYQFPISKKHVADIRLKLRAPEP